MVLSEAFDDIARLVVKIPVLIPVSVNSSLRETPLAPVKTLTVETLTVKNSICIGLKFASTSLTSTVNIPFARSGTGPMVTVAICAIGNIT